jgi:hypothetical protein
MVWFVVVVDGVSGVPKSSHTRTLFRTLYNLLFGKECQSSSATRTVKDTHTHPILDLVSTRLMQRHKSIPNRPNPALPPARCDGGFKAYVFVRTGDLGIRQPPPKSPFRGFSLGCDTAMVVHSTQLDLGFFKIWGSMPPCDVCDFTKIPKSQFVR